MVDSVAGVVLAAGAGRRLAPLTRLRPKALCPVGSVPLVDSAIERLRPHVDATAVNVHHGGSLLLAHLAGRVHISLEEPVVLGTAGALGQLRDWISDRPALVTNADAWLPADLALLRHDWDGERIRLLVVDDPHRGDFGRFRYCGASLMPWSVVRALTATPSGLYDECWRPARETGRLELVVHDGPFIDCGTPADYLAANLASSGGASVIAPDARVDPGAVVDRSVVWPQSVVHGTEELVDAIRAGRHTVLVR